MNEELVFRKIINCTNRTQIRNIGQYLKMENGMQQ
jgi:hypothetical protein